MNIIQTQEQLPVPQKHTPLSKKQLENVSKKLTAILRHHLDKIPGINSVNSAGYAKLNILLSMSEFENMNLSIDDIKQICESNEKQRLSLITDSDGTFLIGATQGHSSECIKKVDIDLTKLFTKITEPLEYCVHGTNHINYEKIVLSGELNRMNRTHIHFASKPDAISGFRKSSTVLIHIDMKSAMDDGIEFFMSTNGVILSEGPIAMKYFKY